MVNDKRSEVSIELFDVEEPGGRAHALEHLASDSDPAQVARSLRRGLIALAPVALVMWLPFALPIIEARLITRFVALAVALLGLQFTVGVAGQLSLCHGVFVGVGSYALTIAVARHGLPHFVAVAIAPVAGLVAGAIVGALAIRIKATYLGPVTLSIAVAFPMIVKRFGWYTGGASGLPLVRPLPTPAWFATPARQHQWNHLVVVALAIGAWFVARNVIHSAVGLSVRAIAENHLSAAASGINVWRTRVAAAAWAGALGAFGGALLVLDTPVVGADSYDLFRSLSYYAAVTVGGAALLGGAPIGAGILVAVPWLIDRSGTRLSSNLVFGTLLVACTVGAPGGIAPAVARAARLLVPHRIIGTAEVASAGGRSVRS